MTLLLHVILIVALSYVLGRSAGAVGKHVRVLGKSLRVSDFTLSFLILGFATSMPEISVALFSAARGVPGLSLGNLLGANVVILSLLSGIAAMSAGRLKMGAFHKDRLFPLFLLVVALPAGAVLDGKVTRFEGVLMFAAYLFFTAHFYKKRGEFPALAVEDGAHERRRDSGLRLAAAIALLLVTSFFLVKSALFVAQAAGLPPLLIGLLLLSIGTNLPEFTFVITQSKGRGRNVVLGDLLGSVLFNTPTLGTLAIISPFTIARPQQAASVALFMLALLALFGLFSWTRHELSRREGAMLIGMYAFFLFLNLLGELTGAA